ncbi:MAG: hypothetical protein JWN56_2002 [Sphingobacteriales bacterium]|nr:hypothetical protein [Sphingobacteriales bacterium]
MKKRILILDDDHDTLLVLKDSLTVAGFEVMDLYYSDHLPHLIEEFKPNLLLLDYILFGENGGDICTNIKHDPKTKDLPIVLMSGYPRLSETMGNYGCNAMIAKPFDLDQLIKVLNNVLDKVMIN